MFLKEFRKKENLSQRELALKLEIAQPSIARYESSTDEVSPSSNVIMKYVEKCDASPNFLFLNKGQHLLSNVIELDDDIAKLTQDAINLLSKENFVEKVTDMMINEILDRLDYNKDKNNIFFKLLSLVNLDEEFRCRPFLFLYYIFQIIYKNTKNEDLTLIKNYRDYIIDTIFSYKVLDIKNQPVFTDNSKSEISKLIEYKTNEEECKFLLLNSANVLSALELKMPYHLIEEHRDVFK